MLMNRPMTRTLMLCILTTAAFSAQPVRADETALDRYIAKPDPVFAWKLEKTIPGEGVRTHVIDLTSQEWRPAREVDKPVWKHWLTVTVPDNAKPGTAMLFIGGGSSKDAAPDKISARSAMIAKETGTAVAELSNVPNQPLAFADSKDQARYEDDLIAYTRIKHMVFKDETWLVRLAMVKSAVRAMDAVQAFLKSPEGGGLAVDHFVVSGASKRGWTTWLTAVEDPRVTAIIPLVIDALNSEAVTRHHYEVYGFFSTALNDYVNHGLFPLKIGTPEYREILAIEDPYHYRDRDRLKIPKYMINAAGDEFFVPDNARFYYGKMPDEKHLRYVPNTKHNLGESDAVQSLTAFYQAVLSGTPRPEYSWKLGKDGELAVKSKVKPAAVTLWQATNPEARDFRLDVIGKAYQPSPVTEAKPGEYVAKVAAPAKGYTAFFVELEYPSGGKHPFKFTTQVYVTPDTMPFKWEDAVKAAKDGTLPMR